MPSSPTPARTQPAVYETSTPAASSPTAPSPPTVSSPPFIKESRILTNPEPVSPPPPESPDLSTPTPPRPEEIHDYLALANRAKALMNSIMSARQLEAFASSNLTSQDLKERILHKNEEESPCNLSPAFLELLSGKQG